jgi:hypothetical protein
MTNEIIQSDIDLTRHMLDQRCADPEIIRILGKRGIDTDRAALLVDDMRHGRNVIPCFPLGYRIPLEPAGRGATPLAVAGKPAAVRRRAVQRTASTATALLEEADSEAPPFSAPLISVDPETAKRADPKPRRMSLLKWVALVLVLIALGIAVWTLWSPVG